MPALNERFKEILSPLGVGGRLIEAVSHWLPACVCWCPLAKGQKQLLENWRLPPAHLEGCDRTAAELQPYLLGPWSSVWLDPSVWGVGGMPLSDYVVKRAASRLLVLSHCAADPGFSLVGGKRPRLWEVDEGSGLVALEARWGSAYAARLALDAAREAGPGGSTGGRRTRRRLHEVAGPLYAPGWVQDAQVRVPPLERAAARAQRDFLAGDGRGRGDAVDVLLAGPQGQVRPAPPWRMAFGRLRQARLDRPLRYFGWQLLHGALRCGASQVAWAKAESGGDLAESCGCCAAVCCVTASPPPDTYSHIFVQCPVVLPAVEWLRGVWSRIGGEPPPPLDARVLVVGDHTVWEPGGGRDFSALWHHLRLLFGRAVWTLHGRRAVHAQPYTAAAVVALVSAWVARAVRLDWMRVGVGVDSLAAMPSWCVISKQYGLTREQFDQRWCLGGVLASVEGGAAEPQLRVHVPRLDA